MMFFAQSFFNGGFFGGTGAAGGWGIGKILRERLPEEIAVSRESFGAISEAVQAVIREVARERAMDDSWDEEELQDELRRRLRAPWSSHYLGALMEALESERARQERLAGQMRHFRIAPCECGTSSGFVLEQGRWKVECPSCGEASAAEDEPISALRAWNSRMRRT